MWVENQKGKFRAYERYIDSQGKSRRVSVAMERNTAAERKKAAAVLVARVAELSRVDYNFTFQSIVDAYLARQLQEVKRSTYRRNKASLNRLVPIIGNVTADHLTAGLIQSRLFDHTQNPATYNEYIKRLKAMLRWAYRNDYIRTPDCFEKLQNLKDKTEREKVQDKFLERAELKELISGMEVELWALVTRFLALSGLRVGELVALDMDDVDLDARQIHVYKTYDYRDRVNTSPKTLDSKRDVHIQPDLLTTAKEIKNYTQRFALITGYRTNYFIMSQTGTRMNYFTYNKYLRLNSLRILNKPITAHALRHTHVALMAAQGVPIEVLARRLGHGDSKITRQIYFHVTKDLQKADADLIDKIAGAML